MKNAFSAEGRSLSSQSVELSDLRHIKANLDTLLSDEEYKADLQKLRYTFRTRSAPKFRICGAIDESPMPFSANEARSGIGLFPCFWGVSSNGECAGILYNRRACSA